MNVRAVHQASTLPADEKMFHHFLQWNRLEYIFRPAHSSSLRSIFRSWCVRSVLSPSTLWIQSNFKVAFAFACAWQRHLQLVPLVSRHRRQREICTTTFFIWLKRKQTQYHGLMNFRSENGVDFELQRRETCAVASFAAKSEIGFRRELCAYHIISRWQRQHSLSLIVSTPDTHVI